MMLWSTNGPCLENFFLKITVHVPSCGWLSYFRECGVETSLNVHQIGAKNFGHRIDDGGGSERRCRKHGPSIIPSM